MKKQIEQGLKLHLNPKISTWIIISLLGIFLFTSSAMSAVRVAFLVMYKWNGDPWILEKGGKFSHIAIEVEGGWLHAHPLRGVELISESELQKVGVITEVVELTRKPISNKSIQKYLGKKYDSKFSWHGEEYYCSELVAKILRIKPEIMYFDLELWPEKYSELNGQIGISPDDVYRVIKLKNQAKACGALFNSAAF